MEKAYTLSNDDFVDASQYQKFSEALSAISASTSLSWQAIAQASKLALSNLVFYGKGGSFTVLDACVKRTRYASAFRKLYRALLSSLTQESEGKFSFTFSNCLNFDKGIACYTLKESTDVEALQNTFKQNIRTLNLARHNSGPQFAELDRTLREVKNSKQKTWDDVLKYIDRLQLPAADAEKLYKLKAYAASL